LAATTLPADAYADRDFSGTGFQEKAVRSVVEGMG